MNYRLLLAKYMRHVLAEEGVTFLGGVHSHSLLFTSEDAAELEQIEAEIADLKEQP